MDIFWDILYNLIYSFFKLFLFSTRSPSVGFFVDQDKVIEVNNPDYNVERTEIISSGKQSDLGLNLTKSRHVSHVSDYASNLPHVAAPRALDIDLSEWIGQRILGSKVNKILFTDTDI